MPASVSPLEIFWTVQALSGIGLAVFLVQFWLKKRDFLIRNKFNSWRLAAVRAHLMRKVFYLVSHILFTIAGLLVMTLPPRPPVDEVSRMIGTFVACVFLFVSIGMQVDMVQSYRYYRRLEDQYTGHGGEPVRPSGSAVTVEAQESRGEPYALHMWAFLAFLIVLVWLLSGC